jgi:prolyl 3-hydroxylase /prolyl 3,4-dihydroxylase
MAKPNPRRPSPEPSSGPPLKKIKTAPDAVNGSKHTIEIEDPASHFVSALLEPENALKLHSEYASSEPYKYAVLDKIFQDDLLVKVKDECLGQLSFTEKETDIYKVRPVNRTTTLSI